MFVLPEGLPPQLTPLAFLVGKWSGTGVIAFEGAEHEFSQQIEFAHDGDVLTYISSAKLNDEAGTALDVTLRQHGVPAREVRAQPIRWMKRNTPSA